MPSGQSQKVVNIFSETASRARQKVTKMKGRENLHTSQASLSLDRPMEAAIWEDRSYPTGRRARVLQHRWPYASGHSQPRTQTQSRTIFSLSPSTDPVSIYRRRSFSISGSCLRGLSQEPHRCGRDTSAGGPWWDSNPQPVRSLHRRPVYYHWTTPATSFTKITKIISMSLLILKCTWKIWGDHLRLYVNINALILIHNI